MAERHGIERLRWLIGVPTDPTEIGFAEHVKLSSTVRRTAYLSEGEINIEVAFALIEELHDAIHLGMSMGTALTGGTHALVTVIDRLTPEGVNALVRALEEANTS